MGMEKKRTRILQGKSLLSQQFRVTVRYTLIVGVVFLVAGVMMFASTMVQQVLLEGGYRVSQAVVSLENTVDPITYVKQVQEIYQRDSLSPEMRTIPSSMRQSTMMMGISRFARC